MTLQDMAVGQPVSLELVWGAQTFEIKTSVVGINENGVLVKPFIYNGVVINLPENKLRDVIFNIYTIDARTNSRKTWKNATVVPVVHKGRTYYACSVNAYKKIASDSERRNHQRTMLNINGVLSGATPGQNYPIKIRDISDNGISFLVDDEIALDSPYFKIIFTDTVRGNLFKLTISCRSVRNMLQGEDMFHGCRILEADKNLLMYVFMKRMETKD